jgi:hypothetical protein
MYPLAQTTTPASLEHELEHGHGLDHEHDPTI